MPPKEKVPQLRAYAEFSVGHRHGPGILSVYGERDADRRSKTYRQMVWTDAYGESDEDDGPGTIFSGAGPQDPTDLDAWVRWLQRRTDIPLPRSVAARGLSWADGQPKKLRTREGYAVAIEWIW